MKKLLAILVALMLVTSFASAQAVWGQGKMSAGVGVELGFPTGDWGNWVGMGFGGFGLYQYGLNQDVLLTGQIGYTSWGKKNDLTSGSDLAILVGGKYNLSKQVTPGFYVMAQLGIYSATAKVESQTVSYYGYSYSTPSASNTESKFVLAPGVGYQFGPVDVSAKYVINGDVGNFAINAAYIFPL